MTSLSPTLLASRPGAFIDPHRQAEYPVLLGDSLQDAAGGKTQFFNVQYNWKSKSPSSKQKTVLTKADPQSSGDKAYHLTIQDLAAESRPFKYVGNLKTELPPNGPTNSAPEDQTTSLALVFDQERSAFILEKISAALDFNLTSAPGQSRAEIQALPQLPSIKRPRGPVANANKPTAIPSDDDDEDPDPANPYDYRHFLEDAKANADKGLGSRTPTPGGHSGFPSPVPDTSRFKASSGPDTSRHKPVASAPSAQVKKRKIANDSSRTAVRSSVNGDRVSKPRPTKALPSTSMAASSTPKPLSKARVSGSDEEIGDTITLSRPSNKKRPAVGATAASSNPGYAVSPRIEVDEAADLVIDMGSPPPTARRHLGAGFSSPFAIARSQPRKREGRMHGTSMLDSEEEDAEGELDDDNVDVDVQMRDVDVDADAGPDSDVEDLVLGSPRASTTRAPSLSMSRVGTGADQDEDEDEDYELAAELEAALENDDEDGDGDGGGVGLGITTGGGGGEDESEVSEEE